MILIPNLSTVGPAFIAEKPFTLRKQPGYILALVHTVRLLVLCQREKSYELRRTEKLLAQYTDGRMKAMGMEHKDPEQQVLDD